MTPEMPSESAPAKRLVRAVVWGTVSHLEGHEKQDAASCSGHGVESAVRDVVRDVVRLLAKALERPLATSAD